MKIGDLVRIIKDPNAAQYKFYKDWFLRTMLSEDPMLIVAYAAKQRPRVFKVIHKGEEHHVSEEDVQPYN